MKILLSIVLCITIAGCAYKPPVVEKHNSLPMLIEALATAEIEYSYNNNELLLDCKDKECSDVIQKLNKIKRDDAIKQAYISFN